MDLKEKQIIYVDNKPHIKCGVVMLSTDEKVIDKPFTVGITLCNDGKLRIGNPVGKSESRQHLYITSDEEIKEGDWCYLDNNIDELPEYNGNYIIKVTKDVIESANIVAKKIIATTDTSLVLLNEQYFDVNKKRKSALLEQKNLPQLSQQFIEKYIEEYNKEHRITEVLVEVEEYEFKQTEWFQEAPYTHKYKEWRLKLDSQNQITIRKQKDSWSREEVIKLLNKFAYDVSGNGMLITAQLKVHELWIEENF